MDLLNISFQSIRASLVVTILVWVLFEWKFSPGLFMRRPVLSLAATAEIFFGWWSGFQSGRMMVQGDEKSLHDGQPVACSHHIYPERKSLNFASFQPMLIPRVTKKSSLALRKWWHLQVRSIGTIVRCWTVGFVFSHVNSMTSFVMEGGWKFMKYAGVTTQKF